MDERSRSRGLGRVAQLLGADFPHVRLRLSLDSADLASGRAHAHVVPVCELPPPRGFDYLTLPEAGAASGLALVFRAGERVLEALRRFYLPPVVFAGAGPGGVGNMTVAATRAVAAADVVLTDCLCGEEVLGFARPDAVIVRVGKRGGKASTKQAAINDRILEEVLAGRKVVRLKGGDPSVFGRLEEEIATLRAKSLAYRVLPGIGSASGASAFVGQPLTVRNVASEVILSTGRLAGGGRNPFPLDGSTAPAIALYMSRRVLGSRMDDLLAAGYAPTTPVVIVEKLGCPDARSVAGTIATIADVAEQKDVGTPAVVLVGAQYGEPDHLPLHGLRVWLPAELETGRAQAEALEDLGAVCLRAPLIEPTPLPVDEGALLSRPFDWIVFTSKKSVDFFFALLTKWGFDARRLPKVAVIGDPAVEKLRARGIEPDLNPAEPTRAALCEALIRRGLAGQRILIPASAVAPDHVRMALEPHAREVVRANLYTLRRPRLASVPAADVVLFSSQSTVLSARDSGLVEGIRNAGMLVGGIGPACWRSIQEVGLTLAIKPAGTDPQALARATRLYFARRAVARLQGVRP